MKAVVKRNLYRVPVLREFVRKSRLYWVKKTQPFYDSVHYWENRYQSGGLSGDGSCGRLAVFKAEVLNEFVAKQKIQSVLEFGCGDGNQLSLANYPKYVGVDVSQAAIQLCLDRFCSDQTKTFVHLERDRMVEITAKLRSELVLSLDVIYHLVEDAVYESYMESLFDTAEKFVIIYSSNKDEPGDLPHVRHRNFYSWINQHRPGWSLTEHVPNRYPQGLSAENDTSHADFYFFRKLISND